ncbi:MAG: outer membrane protein assembly factor BamA [Planctomycetota bacterium]|jgi:outer membrane protein insertion porin family
MRGVGRVLVLPAAATVLLLLASPLLKAQEDQEDWWDGKVVQRVEPEGFRRHSFDNFKYRLSVQEGKVLTVEKREQAYRDLWKTNLFDKVRIIPKVSPDNPEQVIVIVHVDEREIVAAVEIVGATAIEIEKLTADLRVTAGSMLDPARLKQDENSIRERYLQEGYHFSTVVREEVETGAGGIRLRWKICEGPRVTVASIRFTGNDGIPDAELRDAMAMKENEWLLMIRLARKPFVLRTLVQDLERIKVYYHTRGWLDIIHGDRVFVSDLRFNRDKTTAFVTIHVDEGPRYRVRSVRLKGNAVLTDEEILGELRLEGGDYYDHDTVNRDARRILALYGERAYINATVIPHQIVALDAPELDLLYEIKENERVFVGMLEFVGNTKTRDDVLRREFTKEGFVPGSEYNQKAFNRAVRRLMEKGWFDVTAPGGGVVARREPGLIEETQDVLIDVTEGTTGNFRFAAGYSSAYGILGMFEFTQRNFDIADLPTSISDIGSAFSGGGQHLNLRAVPARERQAFSLGFVEPYTFGYELSTSISATRISYIRESWDEARSGGGIGLYRGLGPVTAGASFNILQLSFRDLESDAPTIVRQYEGDNMSYTFSPSVSYDTRDSMLLPTEGLLSRLSFEYAGQVLAGDFDYNKITTDTDLYIPLWEWPENVRHVLALEFMAGWVHAKRRQDEVPISERFFLGGRGSIRAFEFRGVGPREFGDPVGGEAVMFGSVEYLFPLFTGMLRGAVFFDIGTLEPEIQDLRHSGFRTAVGFGIRFIIPQLGNVPVSLDFAWPLSKDDEDDRQTITFDIGRLF